MIVPGRHQKDDVLMDIRRRFVIDLRRNPHLRHPLGHSILTPATSEWTVLESSRMLQRLSGIWRTTVLSSLESGCSVSASSEASSSGISPNVSVQQQPYALPQYPFHALGFGDTPQSHNSFPSLSLAPPPAFSRCLP